MTEAPRRCPSREWLNSGGGSSLLVDISVGSRFHAFELARELDERGALSSLYTGYPRFAATKLGAPGRAVRSVGSHEVLNRVVARAWMTGLVARRYDFELASRFDRIVATRLRPGANVFVGWSSQSLQSLRRAKELGMIRILERGSAHIEWQRDALMQAAEDSGLPSEIPEPRIVERELEEYEAADYIAVPSSFAAATFRARGSFGDRLLVNPYGVDLTLFKPPAKRVVDRFLKVIHVGRASVQKGIHHLVEAVGQVPMARLTVVGAVDPGMRRVFSHERVKCLGPVSRTDLCPHYWSSDVFCLLSLQEGLALVIAQAMATELPVVATANTGAEELITDGVEGFIVPAGRPDAAAERLTFLAEHPELRLEMGRRARARVESGFSWADYGDRAFANYHRVLDRRLLDQGFRVSPVAAGPRTAS